MNNPGFSPEFGPNGAVMNAPTMTPKMRAEIERTQRLPTMKELRGALGQPVLTVVLLILIMRNGDWVTALLKSSPWWAGAFAGMAATIVALVIWRTVRFNLKRWELMRTTPDSRSLDVPGWCRWLLAVVDSCAASAWAIATAFFFADIDQAHPEIWWSAGVFAVCAATLALGLRWYASLRRWRWRSGTPSAPRDATPAP